MPGEVQRELEPVGLSAPKSWVEEATNFASVGGDPNDRRLTYDGGALLGGEEGVGGQPSSLGLINSLSVTNGIGLSNFLFSLFSYGVASLPYTGATTSYFFQSCLLAKREPSTKELNFAHTMDG